MAKPVGRPPSGRVRKVTEVLTFLMSEFNVPETVLLKTASKPLLGRRRGFVDEKNDKCRLSQFRKKEMEELNSQIKKLEKLPMLEFSQELKNKLVGLRSKLSLLKNDLYFSRD